MANKILQRSTILCSIIHIYGIYCYSPPLYYAMHLFIGLTLSLANHTYTNRLTQQLDRAYMTFSIPATLLIAPTRALQLGVCAPVAIYLIGKWHESPIIHSLAHYALTAIHLGILCEL